MQAIILAAGQGTRLGNLGKDIPKVMLEVCGKKLIDRILESLVEANITKVIIVVNYKSDIIIDYVKTVYTNLDVIFIDESEYPQKIHNNVYSLSLCNDYLNTDDTILIESDLIYKPSIIKNIINNGKKNVCAVSNYFNYMNGTMLHFSNNIADNISSTSQVKNLDSWYKTVNIYKISKEFSINYFTKILASYVESEKITEYYELALFEAAFNNNVEFNSFYINTLDWYEIDTEIDYDLACIRLSKGLEKYNLIMNRYGGYWKIPEYLDFCYLSNPFFKHEKFNLSISTNLSSIISEYPSGEWVNRKNASRLFDIPIDNILVGNGAGELIQALSKTLKGKVNITYPTYGEYTRHFKHIVDKDAANIHIIINPNNPSGEFIKYEEMLDIITEADRKKEIVIVDESFSDFASSDIAYSLINNDLLSEHKNLIVIKSLGKSYNINGLKLGVIAANPVMIKAIRNNLYSWNINSLAESFLEQAFLYKKDYIESCNKLIEERNWFIDELSKITYISPQKSEANFILIDIDKNKVSSLDLAVKLLNEYNIIVKDISPKYKNKRNCIRIAIKDRESNLKFLSSIKHIFES